MIKQIFILFAWLMFYSGQAGAVTFKIATSAPNGSTWMNEIRDGAKIITQQTQGRVKFKFYTGGVMGSAKSVLKKMRINQLHGGAFTSGDLAEVYPDIQIYGLPFLFRSYPEVDYVRNKMDVSLRQGMAEQGLTILGMSEGGFAYFMSDIPVHGVDELRGKKVWLPEGDEVSETVYEVAGIAAVPLSLSDVYTGLQTGMIDTVASSPMGAIAFQWHTRIKYVTDTPLVYLMGILAMDKKALDKIRGEDRNIVLKVMNDVMERLGGINRKDDAKARVALENQGIQFIGLDQAERARAEQIAEQSITILAKKGVFTGAMYQRLRGHLQHIRKTGSSSADVRH